MERFKIYVHTEAVGLDGGGVKKNAKFWHTMVDGGAIS